MQKSDTTQHPDLADASTPSALSVEQRLDTLMRCLEESAHHDYIGEDVSQLTHALQCAKLADDANADETEIAAALLHDIGHFCSPQKVAQMDGYGSVEHEEIGAGYLASLGFSEDVCALVRGHVEAKRYLVYKHPQYAARMSEASHQTLAHQGGPMSPQEAATFEQDPLHKAKLRLRQWDDTGKIVDLAVPDLAHYRGVLYRQLTRQHTLTASQLQCWRRNGYLHIPGFLEQAQQQALLSWTEEIEQWPETPGKWMKYFEGDKRQLCRVEDFIPYHQGFRELLCGAQTVPLVSALMGEQALLYKEKINFKLPGGSGFGAHQDAPAFTTFGQRYHITLMLSIDASNPENGGLEVVDAAHDKGLLDQAPDGTIHPDEIQRLSWKPIRTQPGDALFFDSYVPHRSGPNHSQHARRALYITYNRASEGDHREDYFRHKRENFPPECEREEGKDYSASAALYNLGNPIN